MLKLRLLRHGIDFQDSYFLTLPYVESEVIINVKKTIRRRIRVILIRDPKRRERWNDQAKAAST